MSSPHAARPTDTIPAHTRERKTLFINSPYERWTTSGFATTRPKNLRSLLPTISLRMLVRTQSQILPRVKRPRCEPGHTRLRGDHLAVFRTHHVVPSSDGSTGRAP